MTAEPKVAAPRVPDTGPPSPRLQRWRGLSAQRAVMILGVFAVLGLVPILTGDHMTGVVGRLLVFGLLAMSLDLLWGYGGQLSFGHAAFFGLGAYGAGLVLVGDGGVALSYAAVAVGILLPTVAGFIMGYLLFQRRVSGVYFAIVTLLVALLLEQLAVTWSGVTGGINGLFGFAPLDFGFATIGSLGSAYYLILAAAASCYLGARWLVGTPFGEAVHAVRVNERRAASLGYSVLAIKTVVFTIACAVAGLAGVLYVPLERFVYPSQLGLVASTSVLVWVVIGGRGTLIGAFVGAFTVEYLASALSGPLQAYWVLAIGLFLVIVVMARPGGLVGMAEAGWERMRALRDREGGADGDA